MKDTDPTHVRFWLWESSSEVLLGPARLPLSPRNAGYRVACLSEQGGLADCTAGGASPASWLLLLSDPGSPTAQQAQLPETPELCGLGYGL